MKHVKSERLKKMESELTDLEQWLKLGLVPKKDIPKHEEEILRVRQKIDEEKDRLQFLRESGDSEEYIAPKKTASRSSFTDMPSIPDIDMGDSSHGGDSGFEQEQSSHGFESSTMSDKDEDTQATQNEDSFADQDEEDEESYFSDKNRWRRGGIVDPDADDW